MNGEGVNVAECNFSDYDSFCYSHSTWHGAEDDASDEMTYLIIASISLGDGAISI